MSSQIGSRDPGFARRLIGSSARGIVAGTLGTLAFDAFLYRRYRREGGEAAFPGWESSEGLDRWDGAPAPALVARQLLEAALKREVPPTDARALNNATHWSFGVANGALYGVLFGSRRSPKAWWGIPFGASVWLGGYAVLPRFGVYKEIWEYDLETLAKDLSGHLVFGATTATAFRVLTEASD